VPNVFTPKLAIHVTFYRRCAHCAVTVLDASLGALLASQTPPNFTDGLAQIDLGSTAHTQVSAEEPTSLRMGGGSAEGAGASASSSPGSGAFAQTPSLWTHSKMYFDGAGDGKQAKNEGRFQIVK
jgi:hypothetical protein